MLKFTIYTLRAMAVFSLAYYIAVLIVSGPKTSFLWFWIFTFFASILFSILLPHLITAKKLSVHRLGSFFMICFWTCLGLFMIMQGVLFYHSHKEPVADADYVIILGAQVRGNVPSKTLHMRILAAAEYLTANPDTIAICSGGKGSGENITEAAAIKQGLLNLGIEENRILLEEHSTSTVENLTFSMELIDSKDRNIVIVTSNFHCFRAVGLAKKIGLTNVSSCNANEQMVTTLQYYVREFFAVGKDFFVGNL